MDDLDGPGFFRSLAQVRADFAHGSLESGVLRRLIPSGKHLLQFHKEVARVLCGMGVYPGQNALPFTGERVGAAASPIEKRRTRVCVFARALCVGCWIRFHADSWLRFGETLLNRKAQRRGRGELEMEEAEETAERNTVFCKCSNWSTRSSGSSAWTMSSSSC